MNDNVKNVFIDHIVALIDTLSYERFISDCIDIVEKKEDTSLFAVFNLETIKRAIGDSILTQIRNRYKHGIIDIIDKDEVRNAITKIFEYVDRGETFDCSINYMTDDVRFKCMLLLQPEKSNRLLFIFTHNNLDVTITVSDDGYLNIITSIIGESSSDVRFSITMVFDGEKYIDPNIFISPSKHVTFRDFIIMFDHIKDISDSLTGHDWLNVITNAITEGAKRLGLKDGNSDYFQTVPSFIDRTFEKEDGIDVQNAIKNVIYNYQYKHGRYHSFKSHFVTLKKNFVFIDPVYDDHNQLKYNANIIFIRNEKGLISPIEIGMLFSESYLQQISFESKYSYTYDAEDILRNFILWLKFRYPNEQFYVSDKYFIVTDYSFIKDDYENFMESIDRAKDKKDYDSKHRISVITTETKE